MSMLELFIKMTLGAVLTMGLGAVLILIVRLIGIERIDSWLDGFLDFLQGF